MSITLTRNYSGKTTELTFNGLTSDVKVGIVYSDNGNNLRIGLKKTLANLKNATFINFEVYLDNIPEGSIFSKLNLLDRTVWSDIISPTSKFSGMKLGFFITI